MRPRSFRTPDWQKRFDLPWQVPDAYPADRMLAEIVSARDQDGPQFEWDVFSQVLNFGAIAPGGSALQNFYVPKNTLFEVTDFNAMFMNSGGTAYTTPDVAPLVQIQIMDGATSRNLFHQNVPLNSIAGFGQFPHVLPIPRRFVPETKVNIVCTNMDSAITTTPTFCMIGRRLVFDKVPPPPTFRSWQGKNRRMYAEDYFAYNFNFGTIAAGATATASTLIEEDADFECVLGMIGSYFNNATTGPWGSAINGNNQLLTAFVITDGQGPKDLENVGGPAYLSLGNGNEPFIFPEPHIFQAQNQVSITIQNAGANPVNSVIATLEGRKIFEVSQ